MVLAALGVSGCTTTSQTTQNFAETSEADADAGFVMPLPETVAVLPESAFADGSRSADLAALPAPSQPGEAAPVMALAPQSAASPIQLASAAAMPRAEPAVLTTATDAAPAPRGHVDGLIAKYANVYGLPEQFVRRVVKRESTFNPKAYNNGHWGLMQIKHATARGMGYDGPANGLLDAETNLKYAVKYLRGAWLVADGDENRADRLYQTGYYYHAKKRGMLEITGLGKDRKRRRDPAAATPALLVETPQQVELPVALN
ncbi:MULTISPECIES: lytic transglycosylase domain-containing protein [Pseudomonadota]|nr:transglycosylase-like protein with SLT domain [Aquamicrobium defluvii]